MCIRDSYQPLTIDNQVGRLPTTNNCQPGWKTDYQPLTTDAQVGRLRTTNMASGTLWTNPLHFHFYQTANTRAVNKKQSKQNVPNYIYQLYLNSKQMKTKHTTQPVQNPLWWCKDSKQNLTPTEKVRQTKHTSAPHKQGKGEQKQARPSKNRPGHVQFAS